MADATNNGGENQTPEAITFNDKQKEVITGLIEDRISRANAKHQEEVARIKADHEAALAAERDKHKGKSNAGTGEQTDAEKEQFKAILEAEKQRTAQALRQLEDERKKSTEVESQNSRILKDVALSDAILKQDTFTFVDANVVKTLTDKYVSYDSDLQTYVVKDDNGVVRQNDSLKPMTLKEFYAEFGTKHPYLVASNVKGGTGAGESTRTLAGGLKQVNTKSDLKDFKEKSEYIKKFGLKAFEELPLK